MPPAKKKQKLSGVPAGVTWTYKDGNKWLEYDKQDQDTLEDAMNQATGSMVVNVKNLTFNKGYGTVYEFDFKKMTQSNQDSGTVRKIRRIQEENSDDEDDESDEESEGPTWNVLDDQGIWVPCYDEDNALIEAAYQNFKTKNASAQFVTASLSFNKGYNSLYTFDFKAMTQTNADSGNTRKLQRANAKPSAWKVKNYGISGKKAEQPADISDKLAFPDTWAPATNPTIDMFPVKEGSAEFKSVLAPFKKTLGRTPVIASLTRVQNYSLWPFYALQRSRIEAKVPKKKEGANEMFLFHGARVKKNMDAITSLGFDIRVANTGSCGYGTYFAVNARYSDSGYVYMDPQGFKHMLICRVLVGKYCKSPGSSCKRPPPLTPSKPELGLYDSVVDNTKQPIMHVVFYDNQAIPEYIVKYK